MPTYLIYHVVEGAQGHRIAMAFFHFKNTTKDLRRNLYPVVLFRLDRTLEMQRLIGKIFSQPQISQQNHSHRDCIGYKAFRLFFVPWVSPKPELRDHRDLPFLLGHFDYLANSQRKTSTLRDPRGVPFEIAWP